MSNSINLILALIAFAANSFFCRFALAEEAIDPGSFTFIRLLSGAITLAVILVIRRDLDDVVRYLLGCFYVVGTHGGGTFTLNYAWFCTGERHCFSAESMACSYRNPHAERGGMGIVVGSFRIWIWLYSLVSSSETDIDVAGLCRST